MKITKKQLRRLVETFIVDPEGRTIDYQKIIELEKEYARTHNPELLKKIDTLKKIWTDLTYDQKYIRPELHTMEKSLYDSALELERGMMQDFGKTKGLNQKDSEHLGNLMYQYGKARGEAEGFHDVPGRVPKQGWGEGGYPTAEQRKERFKLDRAARAKSEALKKVYNNIDALIAPGVNKWFDNNTEELKVDDPRYDLLSVREISYEIADDIATSKGYSDYADLLEQDQEYDSAFKDDEDFVDQIVSKIVEYFDGGGMGDGYIMDGALGYTYLGYDGQYYESSEGNNGYDSPHIGYYSI